MPLRFRQHLKCLGMKEERRADMRPHSEAPNVAGGSRGKVPRGRTISMPPGHKASVSHGSEEYMDDLSTDTADKEEVADDQPAREAATGEQTPDNFHLILDMSRELKLLRTKFEREEARLNYELSTKNRGLAEAEEIGAREKFNTATLKLQCLQLIDEKAHKERELALLRSGNRAMRENHGRK